jgi:hypothetical protein
MAAFALAVVGWSASAAAQFATGLSPPGSPAPGGGPTTLPPPPTGTFGLPNPLAPPGALPTGPLPPSAEAPTPALGLPPPGAGIPTLQLYDPTAPAVIIQPRVTVGERVSTNINYTNPSSAGTETFLDPGVSMSIDTPRFTGVLSGNAEGNLYLPTSKNNGNRVTANEYATGTGRLWDDRLFVDLNSYITEAATLPGYGFISPTLLPTRQTTLVFANTVSPYLRESYYDFVDGELRYRFGSTDYGSNTAVTATTPALASSLTNSTLNEGTLTLLTGPAFQRFVSRWTVDASSFNSNSTSQNTQFSAFDDVQYYFRPNISALLRAGYQDIEYRFAPAATFVGATWLAGGRLGSAADRGYVSLQYGRVQGVLGFTGSANYMVTPTITFRAYLTEGVSTPGQTLQTALAGSTLSPNGAIVSSTSGLPATFFNPGTGLTNGVYRQHIYNFGLDDQIGRNYYSFFAYYSNSQSLTPPITPPTDSTGVSATWSRDIHPDLNGSASAGYTRTTNVVTINTPTPVNNTSTITATVGLNYLLAHQLSGSIVYNFSYQPNGGSIVNGRPGDIVANSLTVYLTKTF